MKWIVRYSEPALECISDLSVEDGDAVLAMVERYVATNEPAPTRVTADPPGVLRLSADRLHVMIRLNSQQAIVQVDHAFREG